MANQGDSNLLVTVCIPTYNGEKWLAECIQSALDQTYQSLEILIIDDGSTDGTVSLARSISDSRIRLLVNEKNQGLVGNWNECIRQASGEYIKFLFQDDTLYPECVERMTEPLSANPELGMAFARREWVFEDDAPESLRRELTENYSNPHLQFERVQPVMDGRDLFAQHVKKELKASCVAEPPSTLIRKSIFRRLGLFNPRLRQMCDIEMWLRILFFYPVAFVDQPLLTFRVHGSSMSASNYVQRRAQYDRFWMLEGLLAHPEIASAYPVLGQWRDDFFRHYQRSLVRPKAGWRSLRSRRGLIEAVGDARELPDRARFVKDVERFRQSPDEIHPALPAN
jgi:glycosyltransferase involved in cell wall biosynthesis